MWSALDSYHTPPAYPSAHLRDVCKSAGSLSFRLATCRQSASHLNRRTRSKAEAEAAGWAQQLPSDTLLIPPTGSPTTPTSRPHQRVHAHTGCPDAGAKGQGLLGAVLELDVNAFLVNCCYSAGQLAAAVVAARANNQLQLRCAPGLHGANPEVAGMPGKKQAVTACRAEAHSPNPGSLGSQADGDAVAAEQVFGVALHLAASLARWGMASILRHAEQAGMPPAVCYVRPPQAGRHCWPRSCSPQFSLTCGRS